MDKSEMMFSVRVTAPGCRLPCSFPKPRACIFFRAKKDASYPNESLYVAGLQVFRKAVQLNC
jgi:hypothetical protein